MATALLASLLAISLFGPASDAETSGWVSDAGTSGRAPAGAETSGPALVPVGTNGRAPVDSLPPDVERPMPEGLAHPASINLDRPLVPADGVADPVFAVLLGFVLENHEGDLDSTRVRREVESEVARRGRKPKLPYKWIEVITRVPRVADDGARPLPSRSLAGTNGAPEGEATPAAPAGEDVADPRAALESRPHHRVTSRFDRKIDLPVPYQILGYHPGSFQGAARLDFEEIGLGDQAITYWIREDKKPVHRPFRIEDVRLYILESGRLQIDIDGWLDRLAGGKLDDTRVAGLVIFRKEGKLYGLALGYNRKGEPRSGTLAFADDKILYPNPPELKAVARQMRSLMEQIEPDLAGRFAKW